MGECVKYKGDYVKIGTCESLYYTTYKQMDELNKKGLLKEADGNLRPDSYLKVNSGFRFRFPFPDEKDIQFGMYDDYDRGVIIKVPKHLGVGMFHDRLFIRTDEISRVKKGAPAIGIEIPCVLSDDNKTKLFDWDRTTELTVFEVIQQKYVTSEDENNEFQIVIRCPYCGAMSRISYEEMVSIAKWVFTHRLHYDHLRKQIILTALRGYKPKK